MGETNFEIRLDFEDVESAKSLGRKLRQLDKVHEGSLEPVLEALLEDVDAFGCRINIEKIQRKDKSIYLFAYGGRSAQPPFAAAARFHQLGCPLSYLRSFYNEGGDAAYYLGASRVGFDKFAAAIRSDDDAKIKQNLFLPEGRVQVEARLIEYEWSENDFGEFCLMKFETADGKEFYYKGSSEKMTLLAEDEYDSNCSFTACFEMGYLRLNGPQVSFAKRPGKITLDRIDATTSGLAALTGSNKSYLREPTGEVVRRYLTDYHGDGDAFVHSLTRDSLAGMDFSDLMSKADASNSDQFLAFGLYVCAQARIKRHLLIECEYGKGRAKQDALLRHVLDLDVDFIKEFEFNRNFAYSWATDEVFVETRIWNAKAAIEICRRLSVCADGKSVKRQYGEFLSEPSLPSDADWLELFNLARNEAESGNTDSMLVYADLLDSKRAWEEQPDAASQWRARAGGQTDTAN